MNKVSFYSYYQLYHNVLLECDELNGMEGKLFLYSNSGGRESGKNLPYILC